MSTEEAAFTTTQGVLAGEARVELDAASTKMLTLLFWMPDADVVITPAHFEVFWGARRQRSEYFRALSPAVVSAILTQANVARVDEPKLIVLGSWQTGRREHPPRRVWIAPSSDVVRLAVRDTAEKQPGVSTSALGLPSNWCPHPRPPVVVDFERPYECPHCRVESTRYRDLLDGAYVCLHCARSFRSVINDRE
jgi:hypothetical protein